MGLFRKPKNEKQVAAHEGNGVFDYDLVAEKTYREHLTALIKKHKAQADGELFLEAYLVPEPTNPFDPNAIQVLIENKPVGYIPKNDCAEFLEVFEANNLMAMRVNARIGWDRNSPSPLIGVRLDFDWG